MKWFDPKFSPAWQEQAAAAIRTGLALMQDGWNFGQTTTTKQLHNGSEEKPPELQNEHGGER